MNCTAQEHYGAFECAHCLVEALIRCKAKNEPAYQTWGRQIRRDNPELFEKVKLILKDGAK